MTDETMNLDALERDVHALGRSLRFPPTPDLTAAVDQAISRPAPVPVVSWQRRLAIAACLAVVLAGSAIAIFPGARSSVARWLGLPGIQIVLVDEAATAVPTAAGPNLLLGERRTLAEVQSLVPYEIRIPAALGQPDEVYLRQLSDGPMVTLLYYPRADLPEVAGSGIGALVMQFPSSTHPGDLAKRISMGIGQVREVDLGEQEAFWITGETQLVLDQDPSESFDDLIARNSGNVLVWREDGLTFRFESALLMRDALAVAATVPTDPPGTPVP